LTFNAEAARIDARRLRHEAEALRLKSQGNVARSRKRLAKAHVEVDRTCKRRMTPQPSPWSTLHWIGADETLEQTLVPVPSRSA
jgi:hypothetical protein